MSGEIIDIAPALAERRFKAQEERLKDMRAAFRAARLGAKVEKAVKSSRTGGGKRKNKNAKPRR